MDNTKISKDKNSLLKSICEVNSSGFFEELNKYLTYALELKKKEMAFIPKITACSNLGRLHNNYCK